MGVSNHVNPAHSLPAAVSAVCSPPSCLQPLIHISTSTCFSLVHKPLWYSIYTVFITNSVVPERRQVGCRHEQVR